ncbi:MAG TPA: DUF1585 domain-containing protein [Myxococcales bacterium]|nr:DUF1585 domain-containing protein [Myxococcales bacterium]
MSGTRWTRVLWALALAGVTAAAQTQSTCSTVKTVPLARQLRQLYLDLLNRPPTIAEYQAAQAKGSISVADVRALMGTTEFYDRMRLYHRALFKSNIAASVYNLGDTRLQGTGDPGSPLATRGVASTNLRGGRNNACNPNIQQSQCNALKEDPQGEPATKTCYDANGVPLPVSYDYDTINYVCTALAATDCAAAVSQGLLPDKYLYYCDMRRSTTNVLQPWRCAVDNTKVGQETLVTEELESGTGRVVAYVDAATPTTKRLDRCSLDLSLKNNLRGSYVPQKGCIQREGWETVPVPFYEPAGSLRTTVQMCAIEAQDRQVNPGTLETCETGRFVSDRSCGCGAGARRCEGLGAAVHNARIAAFNMEPELIADSVLRRDEPYFNLLTTQRSFVNGTLSQFYRQNQGTGVWTVSAPADLSLVPDVPYNQTTTWVEYARDDWHSGVLTSAEYLYRYATWRSRIAAFYDAMLCTHFAPPPNATLPSPDDTCNRENNLAQRCGCSYCHATIEPLGAHWGRFGERGSTYLDPALFPRVDVRCRDCAINGDAFCGGTCTNYVMQAFDGDGANSLGLLKTYLYRTSLEEENIAGGPELLVQRMLATGDLEKCTARRIWKEMLGRPMTQAEEDAYLDDMVTAFVSNGWNLKALIEWVVTSDLYRRID